MKKLAIVRDFEKPAGEFNLHRITFLQDRKHLARDASEKRQIVSLIDHRATFAAA